MKGHHLPVFFNNPVSHPAIAVFPQYGTRNSIYGSIQFIVNSNGSISTSVDLKGFNVKNGPYSLYIHEASVVSDKYCIMHTRGIQTYRQALHYHRDDRPDYDHLLKKENDYIITNNDESESSIKQEQEGIRDKDLIDSLEAIDYTMIGNLSGKYGLIQNKQVEFVRNDATLSLRRGSGAYIGESSVVLRDSKGETIMCSNIHFNYEGLVEQQLVRELSYNKLANNNGNPLLYLSLVVWAGVMIALVYSLITHKSFNTTTDEGKNSGKN